MTTLMERFGVPDALAGDLLEESERRHSSWWLGRQAIVAIGRSIASDIRQHRVLALRALIVGWIVQNLVGRLTWVAVPLMRGAWVWRSELWLDERLGFPVVPLPFLVTTSLGAIMTGWMVARLHRPRGLAMLLAYLASLLLFQVGGFVNSFERGLRQFGGWGLALNSLFPFVIVPGCLLVGGLLSLPHRASRLQRP